MNTEKTSAHRRATRQGAAPSRARTSPKETPPCPCSPCAAPCSAPPYALATALPAAAQSAFPAAGDADRALSCRRLHRPPPAHRGAGRVQVPGPARHRGKPAGRRRHAGAGQHGQDRQAGRLHHFAVHPGHAAHAPHAQDQLGSDQRFHLHRRPVGLYLRLHRARRFAVQNLQRLSRPRARRPAASTTARPARARRRTC